MALSGVPFFPPSRAVVTMIDEGVSIHRVANGSSSFLSTILWREANFELKLTEALNDAKVASVLIMNDAVEQHYRKERIVIPTSFDKANIIKRRLNVAFPSYPMRAALPLKDAPVSKEAKDGKEVDKSKLYLFAAAPSTETFSRIVRSIRKTDYNLFGYGLLPIESSGIIKHINQKLAQKDKKVYNAEWTILVGQHRGGGLRQIVVRSNELALTRVTPIEPPQQNKDDIWANDVFEEIQATLSYLSRFGYSPDDGLNVIILGSKKYSNILSDLMTVPCNFNSLTPYEAGSMVGVKLDQENDDHFADSLHAGWAGKKIMLEMPLSSREIIDVANPRKIASGFMVLLSLGLGVALFESSIEAQGLYQDKANLEVSQAQYAEIEAIYQEEIKRKSDLGIDVNAIMSSLEIDGRIQRQYIDVLGLLKVVSGNLNNLRIDSLKFKNEGDVLWSSPSKTDAPPVRKATLELNFSYAGNINPQDGNKEMDEFVERLNKSLEPIGYKAKVEEPLQNLTYSGEVNREVGLTANLRSLKDRYTSVVLIKKVDNVKSPGQ
jgi:hypothetical protein